MSSRPEISIIIPCYNEQTTIKTLLEAIRRQEIPLSRIEVVIADGLSTDGTREAIEAYRTEHSDLTIRLVDNPARSIPSALNRALQLSNGDTVVRLDAHSVPYPDYVERCLEALEKTGAANVGGAWEIRPGSRTAIAQAIAAAATHPLGAGDARYRVGGTEEEVDTVPFGAFRREWLERVGGYDEQLHTNEDYELNLRLRRAGGVIWFDPAIRSIYFARPTLRQLARQYLRYGYWKGRMLARYPGSLRLRQSIPALFTLGLASLLVLSLFSTWAWTSLLMMLGAYVAVTITAGILVALRSRKIGSAGGFPLALWTIHMCWGSAIWVGLVAGIIVALSSKE
jgi:glycosyltransferase involved in cell wall biosynthesis